MDLSNMTNEAQICEVKIKESFIIHPPVLNLVIYQGDKNWQQIQILGQISLKLCQAGKKHRDMECEYQYMQ